MKTRSRKISPSDQELADEILVVIDSEEVNSNASPMGVYAMYNRLKINKKDWMLSPMRINAAADAMTKSGILCRVSDDDRRYFKKPKGENE
jgi:Asp-tRNA(Asn)/Glu-tRNA(Gln) amidotransferase C subunit